MPTDAHILMYTHTQKHTGKKKKETEGQYARKRMIKKKEAGEQQVERDGRYALSKLTDTHRK